MSKFRFMHTMIRVFDLDKSVGFYTQQLGMNLIKKTDYPDGEFTLAYLGYGEWESDTLIELTYNWERDDNYEIGEGFGHIALGVSDIYKICAELEEKGVEIVRKPGAMKHGKTVIAFVKDPDGYMIELIEE